LAAEKGWAVSEEKGKGYRRTVASPIPREIVEKRVIEIMVESGVIPIAVGGGGIPVVRDPGGRLRGVEAVIDKDRASALLGIGLGFEAMAVVTAVDSIYLNYGSSKAETISRMTVSEAKAYLEEGHFPPGSMMPKVEAAIQFLESGGSEVVVTSPGLLTRALNDGEGTHIVLG
jgi:carbamate kinase